MFLPGRHSVAVTQRAEITCPFVAKFPLGAKQNVWDKNTRLMYLQGIFEGADGLDYLAPGSFTDLDSHRLPYEGAHLAVGSFFAVFREAVTGDYLVHNDFHGFQSLFYAEIPGSAVVVSDGFMGCQRELERQTGSGVSLRGGNLQAQFSTFNGLLNHHTFSRSTIVDGIQKLRPDEYLRIGQAGLQVETFSRFCDLQNRSYVELIDQGLEKGSSLLNSALAWEASEYLLFLSGGRDSRSILAMALAAGVQDQFSVYAKAAHRNDPIDFRTKLRIDREIADKLRRQYDLSLWTDPFAVQLNMDELAIDWWLRNWAEIKSDFGVPGSGSLEPSVRFIGAMGENYRTKADEFLASVPNYDFGMTAESFAQDSKAFFDGICLLHPGANEASWEECRELFLDSLSFDGIPERLDERLEAFNECFRAPAHFGATVPELTLNIWNLNILGIPEFTFAAKSLSRSEREKGKVWRDLNDRVDNKLNSIEFEFEAKNSQGQYREIDQNLDLADWEMVDDLQRTNFASNNARFFGSVVPRSSLNNRLRNIQLLDKFKDVLVPEIGLPRFRHLRKRAEERAILQNRLRGKLEVLDQILDPTLEFPTITRNFRF